MEANVRDQQTKSGRYSIRPPALQACCARDSKRRRTGAVPRAPALAHLALPCLRRAVAHGAVTKASASDTTTAGAWLSRHCRNSYIICTSYRYLYSVPYRMIVTSVPVQVGIASVAWLRVYIYSILFDSFSWLEISMAGCEIHRFCGPPSSVGPSPRIMKTLLCGLLASSASAYTLGVGPAPVAQRMTAPAMVLPELPLQLLADIVDASGEVQMHVNHLSLHPRLITGTFVPFRARSAFTGPLTLQVGSHPSGASL